MGSNPKTGAGAISVKTESPDNASSVLLSYMYFAPSAY